jgi:hypothetical protein
MHDLIIGRKMKFHQQTGKSTRLTQILCVALAIFLTVDKDVDADPDDEVTNKYHQIFILWNWRGKKEPDVTDLSSNTMTGS